ncbi:hypothetical protein [Aeromonas caviae]|uniref:Uncharacterized protein n=1 Tax=Aeromonas caviae TaxID=648 RepID=A0A3S7P967_AERCA|nr:hypothetical protein [Aeromonas caviae]AXB05568.1 hypothetical protein C1C91_11740 [Aeromonas caviae]AXB09630.1 hypothetical protein C0708_14405 [Aeromonas caviae]MDH0319150.1 hypothetical protein [Aeromonas caviae]MDH1448495.1 hypothetical protein [Aeromonas caviae]MDH1452515.1 hypothetical protein [Aeromonas caviae]
MSEEKLKTVSYYLQDNFPEAGESAYEQGDTTGNYLFKIRLVGKVLLLEITECWLEEHPAPEILEHLELYKIAAMMREHPDKIVVITTTEITTKDRQ